LISIPAKAEPALSVCITPAVVRPEDQMSMITACLHRKGFPVGGRPIGFSIVKRWGANDTMLLDSGVPAQSASIASGTDGTALVPLVRGRRSGKVEVRAVFLDDRTVFSSFEVMVLPSPMPLPDLLPAGQGAEGSAAGQEPGSGALVAVKPDLRFKGWLSPDGKVVYKQRPLPSEDKRLSAPGMLELASGDKRMFSSPVGPKELSAGAGPGSALVGVKPSFQFRAWLVPGAEKHHKPFFSAPETKLLAASNEIEDRILRVGTKFFSVPRDAPADIACVTATLTDRSGKPLAGEVIYAYISTFHPEGGQVQESGPVGFKLHCGGFSSDLIPAKDGDIYSNPGVLSLKTGKAGHARIYLTVSDAHGIANICVLHLRKGFRHPLMRYVRIGIGGPSPR